MIDAKSLRLGNFVLVENDYEEVVGINKYEITCRLDETSHGINQSIKDIKPIILTEKWLLRFGFSKEIFNALYIGKEVNGKYFTLYTEDNINYYFFYESDGVKMKRKVDYVHQLQNLYFFLTDKELVLN